MVMKRMLVAAAVLMASTAAAEEPARAPEAVRQLEGCWTGRGEVMGKPVTIAVEARPVALGAILTLDANSVATADPSDRYAAHLVFGGGKGPAEVIGFWSDSFGGSMTATGTGSAQAGGFDISYPYSDAAFVNRWRLSGDQLRWMIVARNRKGEEQPFAAYNMHRIPCGKG